jgi:hypothetical protein
MPRYASEAEHHAKRRQNGTRRAAAEGQRERSLQAWRSQKKEPKGHVMNQKSSDLRGWSPVRLRPQPVGQHPERQRVIESGSGDIEHAY